MKMIVAPNQYEKRFGETSLFLAGSQAHPDWRDKIAKMLDDTELILLSPAWPVRPSDQTYQNARITWEFIHMRRADAILFWFGSTTNYPMPFLELGSFAVANKPIYVGVDPAYKRRQEIVTQMRLAKPDVFVANSLENLVYQVRDKLFQNKLEASRERA